MPTYSAPTGRSSAASRRAQALLAAAFFTALACGRGAPATGDPAGPSGSVGSSSALPFIEDDAARAFAEARQRQVPVFVEVWAPW